MLAQVSEDRPAPRRSLLVRFFIANGV